MMNGMIDHRESPEPGAKTMEEGAGVFDRWRKARHPSRVHGRQALGTCGLGDAELWRVIRDRERLLSDFSQTADTEVAKRPESSPA